MAENFRVPSKWYASKDDPAVREMFDRAERELASRNKAKVAIIERIPATFVDAMKEVIALIQRADPSTTTESDDLIQIFRDHPHCPVIIGGLWEPEEQRFGFVMHEGTYGEEFRYHLSYLEIEGIANGKTVEREMFRCEPDCGCRNDRSECCERCD